MLKTRSLFRELPRRRSVPSTYYPQTPSRAFSFQRSSPLFLSGMRNHKNNLRRAKQLRWNSTSPPPAAAAATAANTDTVPEPSFRDLQMVAFNQGLPFIGFGFLDNAILIIAGDAIDNSMGVYLGISTLCAAAIGNIISDLAGLGLGTAIEDFCANVLKLPVPDISSAQRRLRSVRMSSNLGMAIGMTIGCIIGMFPLFFIDGHKAEHLKQKSHLEALFQDVVTEAKTLIGAESTCLYLRVRIEGDDNDTITSKSSGGGEEGGEKQSSTSSSVKSNWQGVNSGKSGNWMFAASSQQRFQPAVDGDHLYAMYYVVPTGSKESSSSSSNNPPPTVKDTKESDSRFIPIGKGIVSRAVLTGEAWNVPNVQKEPDFLPDLYEYDGSLPSHLKNVVVVPVLDGQGQTIAVIRALNKIPEGGTAGSRNAHKPTSEPGTMAHAKGVLVRAATRRMIKTTPEGFTDADVQILKSLASHVSVSLQRLFRDEENEEMRLRDTIRILKEHGLEGIGDESSAKAIPLFPR
jgi:GAF domain-containing protein